VFDLNLKDFAPYKSLDFTKNGKFLLMGSKKGHVAMLDWKQKELRCEFQTKQLVRDVHFLQDENMFAVAQKKHLFIYDSQGIELHQMRDHMEPAHLEYLPYHFLLATATKLGFIKYLDISVGKEIAECKTRRGEATCLKMNPHNAVICSGHTNGEVAMWTPNLASKPVVKMLAHISSPVTSLAVSRCGKYMATTGKDSRFKIWDIRNTYRCVYDYFTPTPATSVDFSDTGLVSLSFGNEVQVWRNTAHEK
jgi:U3 small nucleolar RNA-associated protein 7